MQHNDTVTRQSLMEMIMTSLVSNDALLHDMLEDVHNRFQAKLDAHKVQQFLNTVQLHMDDSINLYS